VEALAQVQQRKGDGKQAAQALEFARRAKLTTIADHREQLKLVLAGKQIKDAAAGTRQAQPTGTPAPNPSGWQQATSMYAMGGYGYDDYGYGESTSALLPSLCIKLGDFGRAERLYLPLLQRRRRRGPPALARIPDVGSGGQGPRPGTHAAGAHAA
jgi:hypothetical protein